MMLDTVDDQYLFLGVADDVMYRIVRERGRFESCVNNTDFLVGRDARAIRYAMY